MSPAPAPALPASAPTAVTPALRAVAARHPERRIDVIVQLASARADVEQVVKRARGRVTRRLPIIHGAAVRITAADAVRLARSAGVRAVSLDAAVASTGAVDSTALETSFNQSIRSDRSWGMGGTGKGVGVAVIDTGIDGANPDFRVSQTDKRSRVIASAVVNPAAKDARDTLGHGTHIAGLIAGNGTNRDAGDPLVGRYAGVAPDANLISVKVDDGAGHTTIADVIAGVQFAVDFRRDLNIRVINLSLRSTVAESYLTDPLDAAVEEAWFAGIVVVAAAGNGGDAAGAVTYAPANDPHIITVGAVDDQRTKSTDDDRLASWSSRGVTQDGVEKPDVVAPGARLVSSLAPARPSTPPPARPASWTGPTCVSAGRRWPRASCPAPSPTC